MDPARPLRLERARSLVLHTHLGLADVAAATGFSSHSHFLRSYRALYGENPSRTRRAMAERAE